MNLRENGAVAPDTSSGLQVLIVDEDLDSRVALRRALQRSGVGVAGESGYGTSAVSLALAVRPDVMFLAVEEPAARALDTADGLANALPETPILVVSSVADAASVRRAMVIGARDYIVKPVDGPRVHEAIHLALAQEERRQMRRSGQLAGLQGRGMVITVSGAKGGVGKSLVSANLSVALRQETGRSVVVLDADTQFGDVATLFDVAPSITVRDLIEHRAELDRTNVREYVTPHPSGVDIVASSEEEDTWYRCDAEDVTRIIDAFASIYDFVVVDTSGSFDPFVRTCIEASTLTLVVSSGDVSSVRDTAAAVRRLDRWGVSDERVRYILNDSRPDGSVDPERFAEAIGRNLFWTIPHDRACVESVQLGQPLVIDHGSKAGASITQLARRVAGQSAGSTFRQQEPKALWRRVLPLKGTRDNDATLESIPNPARR